MITGDSPWCAQDGKSRQYRIKHMLYWATDLDSIAEQSLLRI